MHGGVATARACKKVRRRAARPATTDRLLTSQYQAWYMWHTPEALLPNVRVCYRWTPGYDRIRASSWTMRQEVCGMRSGLGFEALPQHQMDIFKRSDALQLVYLRYSASRLSFVYRPEPLSVFVRLDRAPQLPTACAVIFNDRERLRAGCTCHVSPTWTD